MSIIIYAGNSDDLFICFAFFAIIFISQKMNQA